MEIVESCVYIATVNKQKVLIFLIVVKYYIKLLNTTKKLERIEQTNRETEIEQ